MAMYVYSTEGEPVGFVHGTFIHDMEGGPLGRIIGSRVHRFDGSYVGEWYKNMVVDRPEAQPRKIPPVKPPPRQTAPGRSYRLQAVIQYGYADAFHLLRDGEAGAEAMGDAEKTGRRAHGSGGGRGREIEEPEQDDPSDLQPPSEMVLLVDDEPKVRETIGHALKELGFRVREARSGKEAFAILKASRPQLMILDFLMPDMDGAEVAREVSRIDPDLPIIFSTGHSALRALRNAAGDEISVLPKPFTVTELGNLLSDKLAKARRPGLAIGS